MQTDHEPLLIVIANDVTERNQMRIQSLFNDKLALVGTLAAGIVHEINNPVSWIRGNLNFLKTEMHSLYDSCNNKEILAQFEKVINESIDGADRIHRIVHDLKGFARSDETEITPIDIHETLNSVINMAMPQIKYRATLEKKFNTDIPKLLLSSGQLHQVFLNIILNAAQAIPEGNVSHNQIVITTSYLKNQIRVDITDTGIGITESNLSHVFEPFFTTKKAGEGTGLGLSICHEIIRKMGGKITIQSTVGKGSTFSIYLPKKN